MTILYLNLQITRSDQTSGHTKWTVSLVIANGRFNLPRGVCVGMYELTDSLYHPRGNEMKKQSEMWQLKKTRLKKLSPAEFVEIFDVATPRKQR